jgi:glycosyltransferase involved in cell wall biosynthesis
MDRCCVPLISVYTPVNSTRWIDRTWKSLKSQKFQDFEWVLVTNGKCQTLPDDILDDPRVRVFAAEDMTGNIGALKRFAVSHTAGELLVELDHDDEFTPDTLQVLYDKADLTQAQFLFSDFAAVKEGYTPHVYSKDYNWESYPFPYAGRQLLAMRSFDVCPVSLGYLPFSPNHVRAFTRKAYNLCGGYDDKLLVADDYDLMVKMYLARTEFIRIPQCLYIYHLHESNTSTDDVKLKAILRAQAKISNTSNEAMVNEWCRRNNLPSYELSVSATTESPFPVLTPLAKLKYDFVDGGEKSLKPIFPMLSDKADNSVGQLCVYHLLPFLNRGLILPFFRECYRILAPGGWMRCRVPSTAGNAAFTNPAYLSYWNKTTFWSFTRRSYADLAGVQDIRFYEARSWDFYPSEKHESVEMLYTQSDLVALKGQRQPGWSGI